MRLSCLILATAIAVSLGHESGQAAPWQEVKDMCLDIASIRPGPQNHTQYKYIFCQLRGTTTEAAVIQTEAVDCNAVRRGDAQISHMSYESGNWKQEKVDIHGPAESWLVPIWRAVCSRR